MSTPSSSAASVREQKLARVIDREVAPIWHDRFARMLLRELPLNAGTFVLDIHSGPGHTTAELLQRLDESSRVVALGRDPWLMQVAKTRVKPEWKRRVYFKAGDIDDVTAMANDTYDLTVANLVLGEQVVDWQAALGELLRVTKPGGQVLATLPMYGTWGEVEDLFEELLRDEDMRREVVTLQKLRRRRPKPSQLVSGLRDLGVAEDDVVVEHERFELLFRSGREFLFAPVVEHGPLGLWKAIIGRAEKPQALFWRFKEAIDTYYAGRVLAVTVVAGLIRLRVPSPTVTNNFAAQYWSRYPSLARLWGTPGAGPKAGADSEDVELDLDFDLDLDIETEAVPTPVAAEDGSGALSSFGDEVSGVSELPAAADAAFGADPLDGLLEQLDAEAEAAAALAAEDAAADARRAVHKTAAVATLGALDDNSSGLRPLPPKPTDAGRSPLPGRLPARPSPAQPGPAQPARPSATPPGPAQPGPASSGLRDKTGKLALPGMKPRVPPPPATGPVPTVPRTPAAKPTGASPLAKVHDDDDLVDFDDVETTEMPRVEPSESSSGARRLPPPPPVGPTKK